MSLNSFVDAAVDKAAKAAKMKVKSMLGGGGGAGAAKQPNKSGGGIGGLFPSIGEGSKGGGDKSKGGLFGGLMSSPSDNINSGAGGGAGAGAGGGAGAGAENTDFNSAVDELAGF